jgi:hypothetical protein
MAFLILPIVSLILYIVGFFSYSLVVYMAVIGFVLAILSYNKCKRAPAGNLYANIGRYFSLALVVMGAVYLAVIVLSQFILGPFLSSII